MIHLLFDIPIEQGCRVQLTPMILNLYKIIGVLLCWPNGHFYYMTRRRALPEL